MGFLWISGRFIVVPGIVDRGRNFDYVSISISNAWATHHSFCMRIDGRQWKLNDMKVENRTIKIPIKYAVIYGAAIVFNHMFSSKMECVRINNEFNGFIAEFTTAFTECKNRLTFWKHQHLLPYITSLLECEYIQNEWYYRIWLAHRLIVVFDVESECKVVSG